MKKTYLLLFGIFSVLLSQAQNARIELHVATEATISANISTMDIDELNDNINSFPVFVHNYNPGGGGGIYQPNFVGIYYTSGKWRLYDEAKNAFIKNTAYNILVPGIGTSQWVHTSTEKNSSANYTIIDHPKINDDSAAQLFVSHMFNPGGYAGTYHLHNVGVSYYKEMKRWVVFNEDLEDMDVNISFNIVVIKSTSSLKHFVHVGDKGNTTDHITYLNHKDLNNNPDAKIMVSHLYNANGEEKGVYNNHPIGVFYTGTKWAIYNDDKAFFSPNVAFNVMILNESNTANIKKEDMEIPSLNISPNPVIQGQSLTVGLFNSNNDPIKLDILDLHGKLVMTKKVDAKSIILEKLSTKDLTDGVYMLRVSSPSLYAVRRIVIQ